MAKAIQALPSFAAVAAGQTATVRFPETATYSAVMLDIKHGAGVAMTSALMKTHIANLKLKVAPRKGGGAITVWDLTGAEYIALLDYYEVPREDGILPLIFARNWLRDVPGVPDGRAGDRFALGTADLSNVTLEVTFDATVITPKISGYGHIYAEGNLPIGQFIKLDTKRGYAAAAAGVFEISDLPVVGPGVGLNSMHFKSALIDKLEMHVNGRIFRETNVPLAKTIQNIETYRSGGRTWQAGYTHVDLAGERYTDIVETTAFRDFRLKLTMSGAANFDVILETVIGVA